MVIVYVFGLVRRAAGSSGGRVTRGVLGVLVGVLLAGLVGVAPVFAAGPTVGWTVGAVAEPSMFSAKDALACEIEEQCDRYQLLVQDVGAQASEGTVKLTDVLPAGLTVLETRSGRGPEGESWGCGSSAGGSTVECQLSEAVVGGQYAPYMEIVVSAPGNETPRVLKNKVSVESENFEHVKAQASSVLETPANAPALPFSVNEFTFEPGDEAGQPELQAGGHPWELTTSLGVPVVATPPETRKIPGSLFEPVKYIKSVIVELPLGFFGNPLNATKPEDQCTEIKLHRQKCPAESQVGTFAIAGGDFAQGQFNYTGASEECCSALYNIKPDAGYPAEFGFTFIRIPVVMYTSTVHTPAGYRLRVVVPGVPREVGLMASKLTFYGEPGAFNGHPENENAFLTNPVDCQAAGITARVELTAWSEPEHPVTKETTAYPSLTGCNVLQFNPSLSFEPTPPGEKQAGTSEADEPSGYTTTVTVPQDEAFSGQATPELRAATVTLPEGVTINPAGGQGVTGCQEQGPDGINIGSDDIGPAGQDLGDPEATELGAGYEGGNGSPYDDGVYHTAHGHCPVSSKVGTVEICTPALPNRANTEGVKEEGEKACQEHAGIAPLAGSVYLAAPECGGAGQEECSAAYAEGKGGPPNKEGKKEGKLYGVYLEAEGSKNGVIIKVPGVVSANPATGQLTSTFKETPQLPFGQLKLHLNDGPRAPLANPQTCGLATTNASFEPWSETPAAVAASSFAVTGCAASMPFSPSFRAGMANTGAGAYSPFTLSFSREDREQDLAGLSVTLPPGLLGKIAGVEQCPQAQANAGTCSPASQIGIASVLAGAGTEPLPVTGGRVYLTGPYGGGPFGLSIVVPAKAGPFNLGEEVVRAAIHINPVTGQVTVANVIPQKRDGVPFRLRTANVEINKPGFTFNATNCSPSSINGQISGDLPNETPGSTVPVTAPYQATGCQNLGFAPQLTASTQSQASKTNGASLTVNISYPQGSYANIKKVDVTLPKALPSRLTTLQKACTEAQFAANPAGCPAASVVGSATAATPLLNSLLTGPAYLVSRGAEFPDLVILLQGEGVEIELVGNTDIKNGITYSKFETVPDAPVSSFQLTLPQGPYSILGTNLPANANYSLCGQNLVMPTEITGQNGAVIKQNTPIAITGACPTSLKPTVKIKQAKLKGNTVLITITTSQNGTVTITGKGLKPIKKTLTAGTHQLKLTLTKTGKNARKHHHKTTLNASIKNTNGTTTTTKTLKL
jgi:hypothetical protein